MRKIILTSVVTALVAAASTVQMATAAERHHGSTSNRPAMSEQVRNSNAYAEPTYVRPDVSSLAEGAMASGIAGR
jgi:hypothetical protein